MPVSLFITGDMHGPSYMGKLDEFSRVFGNRLDKHDVLIVLGDFSLPWNVPASDSDIELMRKIDAYPFTTAFIDGNHENHDMLEILPTVHKFSASASRLSPSITHLQRGRVYTIANHTIFVMGGARSVDAEQLRASSSWWPQEVPSDKERVRADRAIKRHPSVDFVLTHTPPTRQLKRHATEADAPWQPDEFNDWLETHVAQKLKWKQWFYGHMHDDRPWEKPYTPLMHVIYDVDSRFPDELWGPDSALDYWDYGNPF